MARDYNNSNRASVVAANSPFPFPFHRRLRPLNSFLQPQPKRPTHNHKTIFFSSPHTLSILFITTHLRAHPTSTAAPFLPHFTSRVSQHSLILPGISRYSASTLELASLSPSIAHRTSIDLLAIDTLPRSTDPNGSISTSFSPLYKHTTPKQTSRCLEDSTSRSMRSSPPNAHPPAVVEVAVVDVAQLRPASPPLSHPLVVSRRQPSQPETPSRLSQLVHPALVKARLWSADS